MTMERSVWYKLALEIKEQLEAEGCDKCFLVDAVAGRLAVLVEKFMEKNK